MVQNLGLLIQSGALPQSLERLCTAFEDEFQNKSSKGTLITDINSFASQIPTAFATAKRHNKPRLSSLSSHMYDLLKDYMELKLQRTLDMISDKAVSLRSIEMNGVSYTTHTFSHKNCNVVIGDLNGAWFACRIEAIFTYAEADGVVTYVALRKYKELSADDVGRDPYRAFPKVAGKLFYSELDDMCLNEASALICHFALTSMEPENISKGCIHALPLDRVSFILSMLSSFTIGIFRISICLLYIAEFLFSKYY